MTPQIKIRITNLPQVKAAFRQHPRQARRALADSINYAGERARTRILRGQAETTGVRYGVVKGKRGAEGRDRLTIKRARATQSRSDMFYAFQRAYKAPNVSSLRGRVSFVRARQLKRGRKTSRVTFHAFGKRRVVENVFRLGNSRAIFIRVMKGGRRVIRGLFAPSVKDYDRHRREQTSPTDKVLRDMTREFDRQVDRRLKRGR